MFNFKNYTYLELNETACFCTISTKNQGVFVKTEICVYRADIPTICIEMDDLSISTDDILAAVKEKGLNESGL